MENSWKIHGKFIYQNGMIKFQIKLECPNTCSLIEQCDDVYIAMFSILEPGNFIPPHNGPSTLCLRYHLGLSIPQDKNNCFITVNGEKFIWEEGNSSIIDKKLDINDLLILLNDIHSKNINYLIIILL